MINSFKIIKYIENVENNNTSIYKKDFYLQNIELIFNEKYKDIKEKILCVGQVQSGKTKNIEKAIEFAFRNEYDLVIIFAGITNLLKKQTTSRIENSLEMKVKFLDEKNFEKINNYFSQKTKVVCSIFKGSQNINKIYSELKINYLKDKKILIIDDECDFGSINLDKINNSKLYEKISYLYHEIFSGKLLMITGTPFANILSKKSFSLNPDRIVTFKIYPEYCGINFFNEEHYEEIEKYNVEDNHETIIFQSLLTWIVNTSIALLNNSKKFKSHMLLNIENKIKGHKKIVSLVKGQINFIKEKKDTDSYFQENIIKKIESCKMWDKKSYTVKEIFLLINEIIEEISKPDKVLELNSSNILNNENEKIIELLRNNDFLIIIGGNMMSRGFSFENLLVQILLNSPKDIINIDTLLQRCRWFGPRKEKNREKYMKIITSKKIKDALMEARNYVNLFEEGKENDLLYIKKKLIELDKKNKNFNVRSTSEHKK